MKGLKKTSYHLFSISLILVLGFVVRLISISQSNVMFGYDEVQDLILARRIVLDHDLIVIGKAIYGNPDIRHGVFSYYLMAPAIAISRNPSFVALWDGLFSLIAGVVVYYTVKSVFKDFRMSIVALLLFVFSSLVVAYSNWVSHPTFAILFVSLFYFGLWKIFEGRGWGYILSALSLGLAIQANLIFIYLIPIFCVFLIIYKARYPRPTTVLVSFVCFLISMSTIIYTELKFNFSGMRTILNFSKSFDEGGVPFGERVVSFLKNFIEIFSYNIVPQKPMLGFMIGIVFVMVIFWYFIKSGRQDKYRVFFIIFYLFSPALMLLIGYHDKPWSLMGILPAVSIAIAFVISKLRHKPLVVLAVGLILLFNFYEILSAKREKRFFLNIPKSSILSSQLNVIDYTYKSSDGEDFSIDAVSYPLYVNSYWSYNYPWYGIKNYGYMPSWSGSDQLYPFNTLSKPSSNEKYLYLIIDDTPDIPLWAKQEGKKYWDSKATLLEEREIDGFTVQKRKLISHL